MFEFSLQQNQFITGCRVFNSHLLSTALLCQNVKERNNHNKKAVSMAAKKFHALPRRRQIDKLMIVKTRTKSSKAKKEEQRERVWAWLAKQTDL